jgi:hypothetical protein
MEATYRIVSQADGTFAVERTEPGNLGREREVYTNRKLTVLSCVSFGLAACVSAEELRQADATACQRDGFAQGTPEFDKCIQQRQLIRSIDVAVPSGSGRSASGNDKRAPRRSWQTGLSEKACRSCSSSLDRHRVVGNTTT